jgi:hypothetical protein
MASVWEVVAEGGAGSPPPVDWPALKREIVAKLDIEAEYAALGVEFTKPRATAKGWRECHAVGRKDDVASAAVNVVTGVYHDNGGEGLTLGIFDFALRFGEDFGRWSDVLKHFADKAGVDIRGIPSKSGGRVEEAHYDYRDSDGEVRYRIWRYRLPNGKKTFTQHPPDGHGGWRFGSGCMDGVEPLPYRFPELLASADSGDPVFVVEGEKDADRLAAEGLVATTNHQGAQSTDRTWPHFLESFRDRDVFVVPDNDPGGRIHARKVAGYLHGVARSVKVVELPGVGPKGDASDWLDQGYTVEELGRLCASTPTFDPLDVRTPDAPAEDDLSRDATVADLRKQMAATAWAWPLWIPNAALTLLAAEAGTGKTRFCFDLHRRMFHGEPWPDGSPMTMPAGARVLWVVADNQHQEMCDIPAEFGIPDDAVILNASALDPFGGTSLQTVEDLEDFEARIRRVRPALVIIDTITNTGDFKTQDSSDAKRQYKPLQEIAGRCQVPILCVTHLNAGGKVLGRRAVEKVRVVMQMEHPDPDQPHRRKLWVSKSKAIKPDPLGVTMGGSGNDYDADPPVAPDPDAAARGGPGRRGPAPAKLAEAMEWLADRLAVGPLRVSDTRRAWEEAGYDAKTMYRARDEMKVHEFEVDNRKHWQLTGNIDETPF